MGANLTGLTVTALSPTIPVGGVTIAGPQTYTATAGSSITLAGNVTSTAGGAITFNSPVTVSAASVITSDDSDVVFAGTVNGNNDLTVSRHRRQHILRRVGRQLAASATASARSLILQGSRRENFRQHRADTLGYHGGRRSELRGQRDAREWRHGLRSSRASSPAAAPRQQQGFDGLAFDGGFAVTGGAVSVASNGSTLHLRRARHW